MMSGFLLLVYIGR